jgi:hypothetical protein
METLPAVLLLLKGPTFTAPETVTWDPLANNSVPVPVPNEDPPSWMLKQAALETSTVTVNPPLIMTSSPATGEGLPPQVLAALQFPDWELVFVTADMSAPRSRIRANVKGAAHVYRFIEGLEEMSVSGTFLCH